MISSCSRSRWSRNSTNPSGAKSSAPMCRSEMTAMRMGYHTPGSLQGAAGPAACAPQPPVRCVALSISTGVVRLWDKTMEQDHHPRRMLMGAKGEELARQFEARALLEALSDADWKKTTAAEQWTVAVTAHHIASSYEPASHMVKTIATGQ